MTVITIPYRPRAIFKVLHKRQQRWAVIVAHRRAGKTVACVNECIKRALTQTLPNSRFAYIAPFYRQAKAVAWDYFKYYSRPIPGIKINEAELRIDYPNGSRISLYGADNPDALRGLALDGVIADEYGDWRPSVWPYVVRPALADRKGWGIIIGTPKGRNQFYNSYIHALKDQKWLAMILKASESGLLDPEELKDLKDELSEDAYRQEMECDFEAALPGAYYGKEIWQLQQDGRIKPELYNPDLPVHVTMDLGYSDDTAIIWFQVIKNTINIIDCYSNNRLSIEHYHAVLKSKRYKYAYWLWLPHDARAKSLATGRSIEEQFELLGWKTRIVPNLGLMDGIHAARFTLKSCQFDERTEELLDALRQYQREYDEDKHCFREKPRHDWTSHYADAFRYACLVWQEELMKAEDEPVRFPQHRTIQEMIDNHTRKTLEDN